MKLTNESVLAPWQHLSTSVQTELAELLDQYACQLEAGDEVAAQQLLLSHPDLSLHLHGHLESLQLLCRAAAQSRLSASDGVRPMNASLGSSVRSRSKPSFLPDSHAPSVLGDYRIEREIGRGGMGIVYAATQLSLRRNVARKVLPFAAVLDQQQVARFRNEAQAAASLHHPHIVPVFAVSCERGVHCYSMQLIDGQTLEQVIKETSLQSTGVSSIPRPGSSAVNVANDTTLELMRPMAAAAADSELPVGRHAVPLADSTHVQLAGDASTVATIRNRNFVRAKVELMICVAEALDYAHQMGVVHRDIKPSNLLLDAAGKIWVTDFGLAQCRGANHLTAHGNVVGTPLYMSPEQIAAHPQAVDHRTDIYSFGITLYELLTLQRAYAETDREQLLKAIESKDPISLRRLNPAISSDLETIVFKAIAKQKSDRYATAGELAEDLRRYLDGRPTLARRPTAIDRAFKWAVRRQKVVCAAIAISLIAMTGLAVSTLLVSRQSALKDRANHRAQLHLDQAHHAVDRFSGLMAQQLKAIPGTDNLRAQMLREAEQYYLDFIQYAGQTPILETELAKVRFRLAAVYSQLAKFKDAEAQYQLAIAGIRSLPKTSKEEPAIQADLALCLHNLATLRKQQGRYEAALYDYQQAVGLQEPLLRYTARDSRFLREWASTQTNLATLLWACGDQAQAEQRFIKTQIELEDHTRRSPEDTTARKQLVECRNSRVAIMRERDPALAERLLRSNLEELGSFGSTNDTRQALPSLGIPSTLCQLAVARNNLATLLGQRGDSTPAIALMKASIQTLRGQTDEAVNDSEMHQQLAIAHNNLGQLYWGQEPNPQSAREFEQAEAILRRVLESSKADPDALSRLAGILHNRSIIEQHLGNLDDAMQHVAQAIEYQALAIKKAPLNAIYRRTLESHHEQLNHVVEKLHAQNNEDRQTVEIKNTALPSSEDDNDERADRAKDRGGKYDAA